MFDSDATQNSQSKKTTRRIFLTSSVTVAAGIAVLSLRHSSVVEASSSAVHGTPGEVTIVNFSDDGKRLGKETVAKVVKTDGEWRQQLGNNSFNIARQADTEMPYSGVSAKEHSHGIYRCICCETALFSSETKFESGTGWPSFWAPLAKENVLEKTDVSLGMSRTEVKCVRCEGHLGHVFDDGPRPTGLRYCMNSASMRFIKA
jgi:peptide-methionine (R)-S-oxide reductase